MGSYYTTTTPSLIAPQTTSSSMGSFGVVAFIIALAAAIVVYIVFMKADNENKLEGFAKKAYDFLHFKKFFIVDFVKIAYIFAVVYYTLSALYLMTINFVAGLELFIKSNIIARISLEAFMVMYRIYENTKEINQKMKK